MTLRKIISGGQTGADRGGLEGGRDLGLETGGTAPKDYKTENGSDLSLKEFGLEESAIADYRLRTAVNIINSGGTVIFGNANSSGCRLTKKLAELHRKPLAINPTVTELRQFVSRYKIEVLNVAGNRESRNFGICKSVRDKIVKAFGEK